MKEEGLLITCDRCGKTGFFRTTGERATHCGTRWNTFEPADGWTHEHGIGDMCPRCSKEFEKIKLKFEDMKICFKERMARCDE